jgi:hypothetical protein
MAKYKVVVDRPTLATGDGEVRFGDVVAVIDTELSVGTLSSMVTYGQAKLVPLEEGESPAVVGATRESPPQPEQAATEPLPQSADLTNQISEPASDAPSQPTQPSDVKPEDLTEIDKLAPGVDASTIMAVKDLGITTIDQLRERLASGERLIGIGDQRRKLLNSAIG